jgi:hypothetical protein
MSKFPHDDFAKAYLTELLSTIGKATPNRSLKAETRIADLWFELNPQAANQRHGLIMPTASTAIRDGFGCVPTAIAGVYEFPVLQRIGLIVVHQLAKTEETLWLRILGRSGEQQRAIEEFTQHSSENGLHASIEELLTDYRANLESRRQLTPEDEELIMNLSAAYLKKQQEWKQAGLEQSRHEIATNLLREGVAVELIVKATGLSMAEVEGLATATASQPSS